MKLTVLVENMASGMFGAEFGLSYLIEHNGFKLLFDTGHSDLFIRNAQLLNINLNEIDTVVLSHGHWDHGNGLGFLDHKKLVCHPDAFIRRFRKGSNKHIGLSLEKHELEGKFQIQTHRSLYWLAPDILFLGEIPRSIPFESISTPYVDEHDQPDWVPDDSALAIIEDGELIIISGCAHSGICNIIAYSQKVTGIEKVKAVLGGFHLKLDDQQLLDTLDFFRNLKVPFLYPSHCTELPALAWFYAHFRIQQLKTGMQLDFVN